MRKFPENVWRLSRNIKNANAVVCAEEELGRCCRRNTTDVANQKHRKMERERVLYAPNKIHGDGVDMSQPKRRSLGYECQ
jgi:hypothetical protein